MMDQNKAERPPARLILMTPPIGEPGAFADLFAAAFALGDIAAVVARFAPVGDAELSARINALLPLAQERGVAFLLYEQARSAAKVGADGAHLSGTQTLRDALPILKPGLIAGAGGLITRDDAMLAGELGADYVMFGEPDAAGKSPSFEAVIERISWWAEIFEIPCVAFAGTADQAAELARVGADFIALGTALWSDPVRVKTVIAEVAARIAAPETIA
jgi:thiamine-phosphate pyrophosphorylase